MSYRGASPSKRLVRLEFYERAVAMVSNFLRKDSLILAGPDGGDISVLLGLGMRAKHIKACDHDQHAADATEYKFPGIEVHHGDVFRYASKSGPFGSVLLDFCGPLRESTLDGCPAVVKRISPGGVFGICLLSGREQGVIASGVKGCLVEYDGDPFLARAFLITNALHYRSMKLLLRYGWYYRSHGSDSYGKSMIVLLYQVRKGRQIRAEKQVNNAELIECNYDKRDLSEKALRLMRKKRRPELLLDISKQSLAAIKANKTRGTYR